MSRNAITRTSFNKRSMEWIVQIIKEASKMKVNIVRRWRNTETLAEISIACNFNTILGVNQFDKRKGKEINSYHSKIVE